MRLHDLWGSCPKLWAINTLFVCCRGIGADCVNFDIGSSKDFGVHTTLFARNIWGLENLARLDKVPATGATVSAKPGEGGGCKVRGVKGEGAEWGLENVACLDKVPATGAIVSKAREAGWGARSGEPWSRVGGGQGEVDWGLG